MAPNAAPALQRALTEEHFSSLLNELTQRGYTLIGPRLRDGSIDYGLMSSTADLPRGFRTVSGPGFSRLENVGGQTLFGFAAPAYSLKPWLHPPEHCLFRAVRNNGACRVESDGNGRLPPRYAFVGVRACDLAAVVRLDRVLLSDRFVDPVYESRRRGCAVIAVACAHPSATCYCHSMGTGPRPQAGYDILLEGLEDEPIFVASAGSELGCELLEALPAPAPTPAHLEAAQRSTASAVAAQERSVELKGLKEELYSAFEHERWEQTAERCLSCGNCTAVCPTCFCISIDDSTALTGDEASRWRRWDSCFTQSFSYIHGGSVRLSVKSRLRQRIMHKFASWQDQFGDAGCTGCGRCISWCPAGIDFTEEIAMVRSTQGVTA